MSQEELIEFIKANSSYTYDDEEELGVWDLYEYSDEVVVDEILDQHRWTTDKRYVLRFGERFLEVLYTVGSTEMQDGGFEDPEIKEVFPKVITTTIYE